MKKLIITLTHLLICTLLMAQAPQSFEYQAVVRDASGNILTNQAVGVQITLLQGSAAGTNVYQETFSPTTNDYGLMNLQIGTGTTGGDFSTVDWANGPYFIEVALDVTGGTSYSVMGSSQLLSVPYALYAKHVEVDNVDDADNDSTNELQQISISNDTISLSNGGQVKLPKLNKLVLTDENGNDWNITVNQCGDLKTTPVSSAFIEIVEVMYDPIGSGDDQHEWIKIYNPNCFTVDLSEYRVAYGGTSFIEGLQLSGEILANECLVIGGPVSDSTNGFPIYNIAEDFINTGLQNSGTTADGVALYFGEVIPSNNPVDVVIYGISNDNNLPGTDGQPASVNVGDAPSGTSIVKVSGVWQINSLGTTPGICP